MYGSGDFCLEGQELAFLPCSAGDGDVACPAVEFDRLTLPCAFESCLLWCRAPDVQAVAAWADFDVVALVLADDDGRAFGELPVMQAVIEVNASYACADHVAELVALLFCGLVVAPCCWVGAGCVCTGGGVDGYLPAVFEYPVDPSWLFEHVLWDVGFAVCCDSASGGAVSFGCSGCDW